MSRVLIFLALLGFGSYAGALSQFVQDIPVTRGIIARWDIEEGTGTTSTRDETGNGYTATLVDCSESNWQAGPIPSRWWIDASSAIQYLSIADADIFSFTDGSTTNYPFSAEACIKPGVVSGRALLSKWNTGNYEWLFSIEAGKLSLKLDGGNLTELADSAISAHVLHSFGFSYDGDQTVVLYIDGSPVASTTTGTAGIFTNGGASVEIGARQGGYYTIGGPIAFAQIYGADLTQEEHAAIAKECRE